MANQTTERPGRTIQETEIDGMVKSIDGGNASVLLRDQWGAEEIRIMNTEYLREANVSHEGQAFVLHVREYKIGCEHKKEAYVTPVGDMAERTVKRVLSGLDLTKFNDMP